jgi:hypothetical protein
MDAFTSFRNGLSHLDTLLSMAAPAASSVEGEATILPDGQVEIWDVAAAPVLRESVKRVLRSIGTAQDRVWFAGEWAYPYRLSEDAVRWVAESVEATGLRLRP